MPSFTAQEIAIRAGGELVGRGDVTLSGIEQVDVAGPEHLTFIRDERFAKEWAACRASAALVDKKLDLSPGPEKALIKVADTDLALAVVLEMFSQPVPQPPPGVHPTAVVNPSAQLDAGVTVGPGCVVGARVRLAEGCVLHAHVTVLDDCTLGPRCLLYPGVVIRERSVLGAGVIIHPNAVIGADGFGYRPSPDGKGLVKIPHIGNVIIGDGVEIGAGTCIDRGKFAATTIGAGTKLDNLCHIAHNCRIGRSCLLAAQVGLAGSVTVGDGVMMGGQVGVRDHATIGAGARIAACAAVAGDVPPGATYCGVPAQDAKAFWREMASLRKLPELMKALRPKRKDREA